MAYLIANPEETVFQTRVHHFSSRPAGPRLVDLLGSRMVVATAPWDEIRAFIENLGAIKVAAYVLAGADCREGVITRCYIGETGDVFDRFRKHTVDPDKAFVDEAYVIGSLDQKFEKLDVQLLQHRLNDEIERVDRAYIVRGVRPTLPSTDAVRTRQSERDFEDVRRLLPSVGCNILEPRGALRTNAMGHEEDVDRVRLAFPSKFGAFNQAAKDRTDRRSDMKAPTPRREKEGSHQGANSKGSGQRPSFFVLTHAGFFAYGYQHGNEFVVLPGSQMRREQMRSFEDDMANQQRRKDIIDAQVVSKVKSHDDRWQLTRERRFPSRSIAAKVMMGVNLRNDAWVAADADPPAA